MNLGTQSRDGAVTTRTLVAEGAEFNLTELRLAETIHKMVVAFYQLPHRRCELRDREAVLLRPGMARVSAARGRHLIDFVLTIFGYTG